MIQPRLCALCRRRPLCAVGLGRRLGANETSPQKLKAADLQRAARCPDSSKDAQIALVSAVRGDASSSAI